MKWQSVGYLLKIAEQLRDGAKPTDGEISRMIGILQRENAILQKKSVQSRENLASVFYKWGL